MIGKSVFLVWAALMLQPLFAEASIEIDTGSLQLRFNEQGDLLSAKACFPGCTAAVAQYRTLSSSQGMLVFEPLGSANMQVERRRQGATTVLDFTDSRGRVLRRWQVPDDGWSLAVTAHSVQAAMLAGGEDLRPRPSSGFGYLLEQSRYLLFENGAVTNIGFDEAEPVTGGHAEWLGFRNRFWTAMVLPGAPFAFEFETGDSVRDGRVTLGLQGDEGHHLLLYLGPVEPAALKQAAPELDALMYSGLWFWLRWICQALLFLLNAIVVVIPHWGLAVMALSVCVGILMRPLNNIADRLQDQVHQTDAKLSPRLTEIKQQYKGAEQSEKIIEMYKQAGVHPLYSLKSLAGVFVVIPVFIGAFDMLAENIHLAGESFLWISDLSQPDAFLQLPFSAPFFGNSLNLLPFIMTGFSWVASRLHSHPEMDTAWQRRHSRNLVLMSLGFLVLFYTFPAGMVLYWTTNNLISVIKMLWKRRKVDAPKST